MKKNSINSLKTNALLNGIKGMASAIFPLITFPYVSRVLSVESLGKYNFANSFVSYFTLVAGLGITSYAVREGAGIRHDKNKINAFVSEVFSINIYSTILSYFLLTACVILWEKFLAYRELILIFSISIFFNTIGTEWILSIYEEFMYITKRSIIFQFLSVILLLLFVKNENDYYIYACITVLAGSGANLLNIIKVRSLCKVRFVKNIDWKRHMIPIMVLFANSFATTIFANSDIIILGMLESDYSVGIYSLSVKVYIVIKNFLSAILVVSIPRLANYMGKGEVKKYEDTLMQIANAIVVFVLPAMVGLFMLSKQIILFIGGDVYLESVDSLKILSMALIISLFGWMSNSCVLLIHKKERQVLLATACGAVINIILNFITIPIWKYNAAAFTTLISEIVSMTVSLAFSKKYYKPNLISKNMFSVLIGCIGIVIVCALGSFLFEKKLYIMLFDVLGSVVFYIFILLTLGNNILKEYAVAIKSFFHV